MPSERTKEVVRAFNKWCIATKKSTTVESMNEFAAFTGDPFMPPIEDNVMQGRNFIVNETNPEVMRIIRLINGPNGHAILKMMLIRNE